MSSDPLELFTIAESQLRPPVPQAVSVEGEVQAKAQPEPPKLTVFIGHGQDPQWERLRDFLERDDLFNVLYYESGTRAGHASAEVIREMAEKSEMAFLVHTGEDEDKVGDMHARANVVHETGMTQGKISFKRAIVLLEEGCTEYSNIKESLKYDLPKDKLTRYLARYF